MTEHDDPLRLSNVMEVGVRRAMVRRENKGAHATHRCSSHRKTRGCIGRAPFRPRKDALERLDQTPADGERITGFVDGITVATVTRGPSAGLGEDVRLRGLGVIGSGLELDAETIQLSAFTSDGGADRAFGRIARPSRRR